MDNSVKTHIVGQCNNTVGMALGWFYLNHHNLYDPSTPFWSDSWMQRETGVPPGVAPNQPKTEQRPKCTLESCKKNARFHMSLLISVTF